MRFFTFAALLALFAISACRRQEGDADIVVTLDPEFTMDLYEQRDSATGKTIFGLWVESLKPCSGAGCGVDASVQVSAADVRVQLLGVRLVEPPVGNPEPAKQFVPIGNLSEGEYAFTGVLGLSGVIQSKGKLTVSAEGYSLSLPDPKGIEIGEYVLRHIPDHHFWGIASVGSFGQTQLLEDLVRDLKNISEGPDLPPGFYGAFTRAGNGTITLHKSLALSASAAQAVFLRRWNGETAAVKGVLKGYRATAPSTFSIRCFSTKGIL